MATPPKPPAPETLDRQVKPISKPRPNLSPKLEGEKSKSVSKVDENSTNMGRSSEKTVTAVPQLVGPPVRPAPPNVNRNLQNPSQQSLIKKNKKTKQEGKKEKIEKKNLLKSLQLLIKRKTKILLK